MIPRVMIECEDCYEQYSPDDCDPDGPQGVCPECIEENAYYCRADYGDDHVDAWAERIAFADPGGTSALRAATAHNPRNLPCLTCGGADLLTPADRARGYQCDGCADRAERQW